MKWKTKISKVENDTAVIAGYDAVDLVGKITFTEMIFLLMRGSLPKKGEREVLDALLVAASEHGMQVPSIMSARIAQSSGNPVNASIAAGVLSIGDHHGGAGEQAAKLFQERIKEKPKEVVSQMRAQKQRLPGFGHKHYERDPRVAPLFAIAQKNKLLGVYSKFAQELDEELCAQSGKPLHLNIDGVMAALLLDLGFPWQGARALFVLARTAGISAHVVEERLSGEVYRREDDENIVYEGPAERKV